MSWSVVLDHGGDISHLLDTASITKTVRLHSEMKANVNKLEFRVKYDATLFGTLLSYDTIEVTVLDGAVPYFAGYLSPNYKAIIRDGQRYITMIAEDPTLQLLGQIIADPWAKAGYAVCTPAATATSLVHAICAEAGVTLAAGAPTISTTIPYVVVLPDDKLTWAKLLEQILFEYGYVYSFDASGDLALYPTINPSTVTATGTLTTASGTANIRGEIEIEKSPEKYDDIRINYDLVELKSGITVFKDQDSISIAATGDPDGKDYYPLTAKLGEVFSKWNSPDGYDIWVVTSPVLSATLGTGVTLDTALTNYYRKASFAYKNSSASASTITGLSMTGNAYVIASKNTARSSIASAKSLYEYQAKYIYTDSAAETLAEQVGQYYKYSDIKYRIRSQTGLTLGQYVNVVDAVYAGLSTKCRVVGISQHEAPTVVYEYALEGVADFVAITIVTEGGHDGIPTTADFGTSDYYANSPPTNNVDDLVFSSAQNPNGNIDITVEWTYEQGTVPADGFLVYYKRAITTPGTINLNEDPSAFVQAQSTAGAVDYSTTLTLPTRQSGAGSIPIHYRFGVVAFGTRRSGTVPHAGGVVEDAGWIDEVFAADITDMVIRSYKGQGVQRRAVQIDAESIDFIDTPDTSPASPEQLRFRLGRLGVGGAVLADGEMLAKCEMPWSGNTQIISSVSMGNYTDSIFHDGAIRFGYRNASGYLAERIITDGIVGPETVVDGTATIYSNSKIKYFYDEDGLLNIAYRNATSPYNAVHRVLSGSTWGSEIDDALTGFVYFDAIHYRNETVYVMASSAGTANGIYLYRRPDGGGFGTIEYALTSTAVYSIAVAEYNGLLRIVYIETATDDCREVLESTYGVFSSSSLIASGDYRTPSYTKDLTGTLYVYYTDATDSYKIYRKTFDGPSWGTAVLYFDEDVCLSQNIIISTDGSVIIVYTNDGTGTWRFNTLQRYARVGGGFIAKGATDYTLFDGAKIIVSGTSLTGYIGPEGPTGPQGTQGIQGPAATIAVGTVTPGIDPLDAEVINSGTSGAAVFDFTLPKGDQGIQGVGGERGDPGTISTGTTFYKGPKVINSDITITAVDDNYMSIGPITIANGTTVTVDGNWVVV